MAPELIKADRPYTQKVDIWSLGVVLYELASLRKPFNSQNIMTLMMNIKNNNRTQLPDHVTEEMK